tara:strand:- start:193 stop:657 length:465 start_codon:yes stop_codon:yes gene_type:complete
MKKRYNMGGIPDDVQPGLRTVVRPKQAGLRTVVRPKRSYTPQTVMGSPPFVNQAGVPNANAQILHQQNMMIDQLRLNNQHLDMQNKLLNTQIQLKKTIDSARKVKKTTDPGARRSPKQTGGGKRGLESMQEVRKGNKLIIASSNGSMRRGGQIK